MTALGATGTAVGVGGYAGFKNAAGKSPTPVVAPTPVVPTPTPAPALHADSGTVITDLGELEAVEVTSQLTALHAPLVDRSNFRRAVFSLTDEQRAEQIAHFTRPSGFLVEGATSSEYGTAEDIKRFNRAQRFLKSGAPVDLDKDEREFLMEVLCCSQAFSSLEKKEVEKSIIDFFGEDEYKGACLLVSGEMKSIPGLGFHYENLHPDILKKALSIAVEKEDEVTAEYLRRKIK